MRYVYVENGIVASENRYLPMNWNNISNFNSLDVDSLKQFGWYPYRFIETTIPSGYTIDGSYYEITDDEVLEIQTTRPLTDEEQQTIIDLIKNVPKVIQYLPDSVLKQLDKYDMVNILYKKELYPYMEPIIDKYIPDDKDFILDRM